MNKIFASEYDRDSQGRVIFPPDRNLRDLLFPYTDATEHVAKANMIMVRELVKFVSEPGEIILDPFGGTGTAMVASSIGRRTILIELEERFCHIIEQNVKGLSRTVPNADELVTVIPGDCSLILPIPNFANHFIFSPPYANVLKKKGDAEGKMDKTSIDLGYGSATLYSSNPNNISNLNSFMYHQKMEKVYKKCFASIIPGGTITIIIKDHMLAGSRERLSDRAQRDCERIGFKLVERNKWFARGGGYNQINKAMGLEIIEEEDLITMRRE